MLENKTKKIVTVFGTNKAAEGDAVFVLAESLGRLLAENGFTIANGGYGGTMLAAAKGTQLTLHINGQDQEAALNQLNELVNDKFGENE